MLEILLSELPLEVFKKLDKKLSSFIEHESFETLSEIFLM